MDVRAGHVVMDGTTFFHYKYHNHTDKGSHPESEGTEENFPDEITDEHIEKRYGRSIHLSHPDLITRFASVYPPQKAGTSIRYIPFMRVNQLLSMNSLLEPSKNG